MANRKLQVDIDKVLKKVTEGVDDFNGIYDKLQQCNNTNQKEKYEQDLKKEIKKLQRLRDQIKAWIASNDVKDKRALLDNRKLIETQMERFKACEKEMKTKAFSKEGLNMAEKLDPKEIERRDLIDWIANRIEELNLQIEKLEAEAEKLQGTTKKGRKDTTKLNRFASVEHYRERQRWHVGRLELINRLLENCIVTNEKSVDFIEAVTNLQDDVQFYVDHNQESDYIEDDEMYADLNLEEEEEIYAMGDLELHDSHESVADSEAASLEKEKDETHGAHPKRSGRDSEPTSPSKGKTILTPRESDRRPVKEDDKAKKPVDVKLRAGSTPPTSFSKPVILADPPQPLPQRYAAAVAAAAAAAPSSATPSANVVISHAPTAPTIPLASVGISSKPIVASLPVAPPTPNHAPASSRVPLSPQRQSRGPSPQRRNPSPQRTPRLSSPTQHPRRSSPTRSQNPSPQRTEERQPPSPFSASPSQTEPPPVGETSTPVSATDRSGEDKSEADTQPLTMEQEVAAPSTLSDLLRFYEAVKEKNSKPDSYWTQQMLDVSYHSAPDSFDSERQSPYVPRNHYPTPMYYPQVPAPYLENYAVFEKFDADCLFFIFYYMQGTYQQYLAARELKKQSWRFHKKYLTWFQRHEEPKGITDDYEQGSYVYFDYEGAWCQRKKNEFRFEYRFLEDGELI